MFAQISSNNIGRQLAIVLDGQLLTTLTIQATIADGAVVLTDNLTAKEAADFANALDFSVPFPVTVMAEKILLKGRENVRWGYTNQPSEGQRE